MNRFCLLLALSASFSLSTSAPRRIAHALPQPVRVDQSDNWMLGPFVRDSKINPVLESNTGSSFWCPMRKSEVLWEHDNVFNPAATEHNGRLCVLYRAEDNSGQGIGPHTSRIGLATSSDGKQFSRRQAPVLFPSVDLQSKFEWNGGCEDPRIVETNRGFLLTYTAYDGTTARLCSAFSRDLISWRKNGPVFAKAQNGKFSSTWSKSGAIVSELVGDHFRAQKINGVYWMYWGEGPICLATSTDLVNWNPVMDASGNPKPILSARAGTFDSGLTEAGPPAVLTKNGIVLIYNGKNANSGGTSEVGKGAYSAGQALFSKDDPTKLLARSDHPFLKPEEPYETSGQYQSGTVFVEGLAAFHHRLWLFYGTADSKVAVATCPKY